MNFKKHFSLISIILLLPISVSAAPKISIDIRAEVEVTKTIKGKQVIKRVKADHVTPQQTVFYTLSYDN
jgi:hypothetical protein